MRTRISMTVNDTLGILKYNASPGLDFPSPPHRICLNNKQCDVENIQTSPFVA